MKALKPPPFTALAERLGIDLNAPVPPQAPVDGPAIMPCRREDLDGTRCHGMQRLVERGDPICILRCDTCDFEAGHPTRKLDPQVSRQRRLEQAEIPMRFKGLRFEEDDLNRSALEVVRSWLAGADVNPVDRAKSLLPALALYGNPGVGKSHLLAAICVRLVRELDLSAYFVSARRLLRDLQNFEDNRARASAWHRATTVDVLALDDLGAQRGTDWRHDQLADLVDERYQRELPILLATNYAPAMWGDVLDARTFSRLRGMTLAVELRGRDRRQVERTVA